MFDLGTITFIFSSLPINIITVFFFRYEPQSLPQFPSCKHNQKAFRCELVSCQDIRKFHRNFYKCKTKLEQDNYFLRYCHVKLTTKKIQAVKEN